VPFLHTATRESPLEIWMEWAQQFEADFDVALCGAQCHLYGVADIGQVPPCEAELQRSQPKAGVCPVQWGAQDIAFCCLDCGYDSSCVQCVDCFFKANHEGHDVRLHRTTGGTCDCGDPSSWDPAGFCPDHSATPPGLDGPQALELLPPEVCGRAEEVLPALVEQVDALVARGSGGLKRAAQLLGALKRIGEVAFGFRHIVCEQLQGARLSAWIEAHALSGAAREDQEGDTEGMTSTFCSALCDLFLLYVQVSPSFKRRFARAYLECSSKVMEERSDGGGGLAGLSVQLYTIPEVAMELVAEHSLLERLSGMLAENLETFVEDGVMTFDEQKMSSGKFLRMHRLIVDLGYAIGNPEVCRHVLREPTAQEALLRPLKIMWRMNPQSRQTQSHILYEELAYSQVFPLETLYLQRLGALGDYCRRPEATLEELRLWYSALSAALTSPACQVVNTADRASFHLPAMRLLIRCMNFELLADEGLGDWSDMFPNPALMVLLTHSVRTLRFAAEICSGRWVRNGESMRAQEAEYQRQLQQFDVMALQVSLILLARQAGPPAEGSVRAEPVMQLWMATVGDGPPVAYREDASLPDKWRALLEANSRPTARSSSAANARLRIDLFWSLLVNALSSLFPVEVAMCNRKWASRFAARSPTLLQRCFIQALARQPLTVPELSAAVPKEVGAREAHVTEALADVAVRQDRKYVLQQRSWRLYDAFLQPPASSRAVRDRSGAEEAALAQREASLLGPRRAERLALAPQLQDVLVGSLRFSQLVDLALDFVHHQCFARLFPEACTQAELQLDNAFAHCLKVLDVICDVSGSEGGCSAVAAQLCRPPGLDLRQGQCVVLQGLAEELDGQLGTVGLEADSEGRRHVILLASATGTSRSVVQALPEQLKCPTALATRHDVLLDRLDVLHKAGCDHALLARLLSPQALPQRLRDRWKALGLRGDEPLATGMEDSGETRKRLRAEAMRKRQEALLRRMREQQQAAAAELGGGGGMNDEADGKEGEDAEEKEGEDMGTCSTCREVGTWAVDPLAVVAAVGPSKASRCHSRSEGCTARFTTCGHLIHARCCHRHADTVRAQARGGTHFFVNPERGQFPCPMCRSLANCALPCVATADLFERVVSGSDAAQGSEGSAAEDDKTSGRVAVAWAVEATCWEPLRVRTPPPELRRALMLVDRCTSHAVREAEEEQTLPIPAPVEGDTADGFPTPRIAAAVLDAACAELEVASALSPLQLAEHGPPLPLYVTLLRNALLFRRLEGRGPPAFPYQTERPSAEVEADLAASALTPSAVWTVDVKASLADALVGGLGSEAGLAQGAFSSLVGTYLQVRALQLCHGLGAAALARGEAEASGSEAASEVVAGLVAFLAFAAWLCAAIWHIPALERTRLAYLDCRDPSSLPTLTALLRLTGLSSLEEILGAARKRAFFPTADAPLPLQVGTIGLGLLGSLQLQPLVDLPELYLELIRQLRGRRCASCGREPPEPALCLLCGGLVCMDSKTCRGRDAGEGRCTAHARRCGAGQGLFLLPHLASVLAVSAPVCCLWDAPYVDQNGEPNPYLRRPCAMQLRLDRRRLDSLQQICSKASIHREIIQHNEKTRRYIEHAL